jgi:protein MAK11
MPKTKPSVKSSVRPHPLSKKAKKPQVQVTYEDGSSKPVPIPQVNKDVKGKGKAKQDKELKEQIEIPEPVEEDGDEEDIKPIIKEEDGVFQHAIEQSVSASSSGPSTASFVIIAGSYEKNLYGIEGKFVTSVEEDEEPELKLAPSFIFPAHLSCIKSLSVSQGAKWLVTGSDDEYIKVWDLRKRKEVGALSQHVGQSRITRSQMAAS